MESTLLLGLGRVGKTLLTAEYVTTEDLDCDKYVFDTGASLREYLYYLEMPNVYYFKSTEEILKASRSNSGKIILVVDDIALSMDWNFISESISELQLVLKDRLVVKATAGSWLINSESLLSEVIKTFKFTNVTDIDNNWVLTPTVPAKLFRHKNKDVIKEVNINDLAGKWFRIREENEIRYNQEASSFIG